MESNDKFNNSDGIVYIHSENSMNNSKKYKMNQTDERALYEFCNLIGLQGCQQKMSWPLKRALHELPDNEKELLKELLIFNEKHAPAKRVLRLDKVLNGWANGPTSVQARIEDMSRRIASGLATGKAKLVENQEKAPEKRDHRADWIVKRRGELHEQYDLEMADEVQLEILVGTEHKILEMNKLGKFANKGDLEKLEMLVSLQNQLMKSLGITRTDRKKQKDEKKGTENWESMLRQFSTNREEKYRDADEQLKDDWAKMRDAESRNKQSLEDMGYYGE